MNLYDLDSPAFHRVDPPTSAIAAKAHLESGRQLRNADRVLTLVREHPDSTAIELFDLASVEVRSLLVEPQEVRRRLTDLLKAGRVVQGAARECRVRGSKMVTWRAK